MKRLILFFIPAMTLLPMGCNQHKHHMEAAETQHQDSHAGHASTDHAAPAPSGPATVKAQFSSTDPAAEKQIHSIVDQYLKLKNALIAHDSLAAKNAAGALAATISGFDKSYLPAEQKPAYDQYTAAIAPAARQIAQTTGTERQRQLFASLSGQVYQLVKAFGGGRPLYHDHCPMALNNEGAMWVSESKEIRNPYFGDQMLTCGTVEEIIQ